MDLRCSRCDNAVYHTRREFTVRFRLFHFRLSNPGQDVKEFHRARKTVAHAEEINLLRIRKAEGRQNLFVLSNTNSFYISCTALRCFEEGRLPGLLIETRQHISCPGSPVKEVRHLTAVFDADIRYRDGTPLVSAVLCFNRLFEQASRREDCERPPVFSPKGFCLIEQIKGNTRIVGNSAGLAEPFGTFSDSLRE